MEQIILGRTGLKVSVAGLGGGGHSRLGLGKFGEEHAAGIVRKAFDAGVNFFDTSAAYGTEAAIGRGLKGIARDQYVLSSKFPYNSFGGEFEKPDALMATLENALRALGTEYVDVYHLHGLAPADYIRARDTFIPVMEKAKEQGKLRFFGVTERFMIDRSHEMLKQSLEEGIFDVIMTGFNYLNPSAAKTVLPVALRNNIGVLCMFAVRTALSNQERLQANLDIIAEHGQGGPGFKPSPDILDFLKEDGAAESVIDAAYRFCRHSPGISVTLTGTSNAEHLEENLRSIQRPPLPEKVLARLDSLFGKVDCIDSE
ncbi:MAG: aldo/keto reductase [Clostridiales bacterium]|nr:aldo/keto reductase [Clostridiales bacterium]